MPTNAMDVGAAWANIGKNVMLGQNAYEQGKTKMAQALAQQAMMDSHARAFDSQAALNAEKVADSQQRRQYQTPEFATQIASALSGLSDTQGQQIADYQKNGNWGMNPAYADESRQMTMAPSPKAAPEFATPDAIRQFNMARGAHLANIGGTGNTNGEQMVDAYAKLLGQGRINDVISDPSKAAALGKAMAASKGSALFHQGQNGVMDQFTGAETLNDVGKSAAMENRAQAGNASASAALHRAQIPEVQSRITLNNSKIGAPVVNPDGSITTPAGKPVKLSATAEKELFEADDNIKAGNSTIGLLKQALDLNSQAYSGVGANIRAKIRSNLPGESASANATVNLDNIMTTQALESLKSTFGAAPTEGERRILLDIQASADKTPKQREEIINRAIKAAEQRLIFNTNKARALRSGTYNVMDPQTQPGVSASPVISGIPEKAIAHLKANPNLINAFAAKYGKEAADAVLKGQ